VAVNKMNLWELKTEAVAAILSRDRNQIALSCPRKHQATAEKCDCSWPLDVLLWMDL